MIIVCMASCVAINQAGAVEEPPEWDDLVRKYQKQAWELGTPFLTVEHVIGRLPKRTRKQWHVHSDGGKSGGTIAQFYTNLMKASHAAQPRFTFLENIRCIITVS